MKKSRRRVVKVCVQSRQYTRPNDAEFEGLDDGEAVVSDAIVRSGKPCNRVARGQRAHATGWTGEGVETWKLTDQQGTASTVATRA